MTLLEIVCICTFTTHLAVLAHRKRRALAWALLGPICWLLGKLVGGLIGWILIPEDFFVIVMMLNGTAVGVAAAWVMLSRLAPGPERSA